MLDAPKAYKQWVVLTITNSFRSRPILIQHASLSWGKFYQNGDKGAELTPEQIDQIVIPPGSEHSVSSCGRSDASSGTEGTIDVYDDETKVCTLYWNCPWGSPTNNFEVRNVNKAGGYIVSNGPWNVSGGALGNIAIEAAIRG
ncbi:Aegerolysin family protein [Hygrophoropsis aurantiaca]|uniref:Aegerolysin family protein n=1 Tax=Hygrophoropsis aurantiaca TaxID=72124 RepID=A0ACB7ZY29_9AGAM|nr:Aegerolysin family protein [Hygrophoropsis aurantiaca]